MVLLAEVNTLSTLELLFLGVYALVLLVPFGLTAALVFLGVWSSLAPLKLDGAPGDSDPPALESRPVLARDVLFAANAAVAVGVLVAAVGVFHALTVASGGGLWGVGLALVAAVFMLALGLRARRPAVRRLGVCRRILAIQGKSLVVWALVIAMAAAFKDGAVAPYFGVGLCGTCFGGWLGQLVAPR